MLDFAVVCEDAARAGGAVLQKWRGRITAREKGPADLVTEADFASQEVIRQTVLGAFPDHDFVGEEDGAIREQRSPYRWIVDPLDGTTNFVHGVPHYCVSVALEHDGKLRNAAVFDPVLDECFTAEASRGAKLNGQPLFVDDVTDLSEVLVAASFPPKIEPGLPALKEFLAIMPACQGIRRGGSAALNLAYVAAGRFGGYWASDLYPWDAAAGALLVTEARGVISGMDHRPFDVWMPKLVAAGTVELHQQICELIREHGCAIPE